MVAEAVVAEPSAVVDVQRTAAVAAEDVTRRYGEGEAAVDALRGVRYQLRAVSSWR